MARVPEINSREEIPDEGRRHYDSIIASRKRISPPYNVLLHAPDLAARTAHLIAYSRFATDFPEAVKELAICLVAREMDCTFEWAAHFDLARRAGVTAEMLTAIERGDPPDTASSEESEVMRYVQELLRPPHRVTSPTFRALTDRLGVARLVELTGIIGAYVGLACTLNAFEIGPAGDERVLPQLVEG